MLVDGRRVVAAQLSHQACGRLKPCPVTNQAKAIMISLRLKASSSNNTRAFSVLHRPQPNYEGHVPLATVERAVLAAGSAIISFINPRRAGMFKTIRLHEKAT